MSPGYGPVAPNAGAHFFLVRMLRRTRSVLSLTCLALFVAGCSPGPIESVLIGTWEITVPIGMDASTFMTFSPDHTMVSFGDSIMGDNKIYYRGRWSADEKQICIEENGAQKDCLQIVKKRSQTLRFRRSGSGHHEVWSRRNIAPPTPPPPPPKLAIGDLDASLLLPAEHPGGSVCLGETLRVCEEHFGASVVHPTAEDKCPDNSHYFTVGQLKISAFLLDNIVASIHYEADRTFSEEAIAALLRANAADSQWVTDLESAGDSFSEFREKEINYKRVDGGAYARYGDVHDLHNLSLWTAAYAKANPNVVH